MIRVAMLCGSIAVSTFVAAQDKQDKKEVSKELMQFQGTWKVVKLLDEAGKEPPGGTPDEVRITFTGNKFSIKLGKDSPQEGTFSVDPKKDPTEMDIMGGPKKEKSLAIYKFDKDGKLTLSYANKPNSMRPKKFGETEAIQMVLEKVKE